MKLDFLSERFSDYKTEFGKERDIDYISIYKDGFYEPITVYDETDFDEYILCFSTQHLHIDDDNKLIEAITEFANADVAAIEFYDNGQNRFGGQIETTLLDGLTYNSLKDYFGYSHLDISNLTFRVYAWDNRYCFEGSFVKNSPDNVEILRKNYVG